MNHEQIKAECEGLGLKVHRVPSHDMTEGYVAVSPGVRIGWTVSQRSGQLVGLPRVEAHRSETQAGSIQEISSLVRG